MSFSPESHSAYHEARLEPDMPVQKLVSSKTGGSSWFERERLQRERRERDPEAYDRMEAEYQHRLKQEWQWYEHDNGND